MAKTKQTSVFIEALDAADGGKGLKWLIRVIRSGKSGNNNFYPDATLREAAPLFDGVRVFVKSDADHLNGQGKSFNQLIGKLSEPNFIEGQGKDGGEIQAALTLLASAGDVPAKLREAFDAGMSDLFGFSIDATGVSVKRGNLREAKKITKVDSVDLIIEPGAGGELIKLIEALNTKADTGDEDDIDMKLKQRMVEAIKTANKGVLPQGLDIEDDESLETAYREALAVKPEPDAAKAPDKTQADAAVNDFEQRIKLVEARAEARTALASSGLPELTVEKLKKKFNDNTEFTAEDFREALKEERDYLAKFTESGKVTGLGGTRVEVEDRSKKLDQMMDDFFDPSKRAFSFRECYVEITGDRGVTGLMQNCDATRLREAMGGDTNFREAISSGTFANVLGNSITRAMVREYAALENYNDWRDLVDIVPVTNFRTQERTRMGGYGNLPAVAENAAYAALTSPSDEKATYAISKRGGKETISLETIANDDVGAIRKVPQRMAVAAARTLYEFVLDFLATNPTVYDTFALFNTPNHANLGAAALSAASFSAARLAVKKQAEAGSAKRLGLVLRHVYVPSELEETAFDMFVRNTNLDETFVQSRKPTVHVVDYWTDANNWFATADKREVPLIELGFYSGNEQPELFIQDLPTQGSLFSNDQIVYKIRHIYGASVLDYRGFYGAIVP